MGLKKSEIKDAQAVCKLDEMLIGCQSKVEAYRLAQGEAIRVAIASGTGNE